ncbi:MAG: hypothetical protein GOMPHAMPRED_006349 [Gomphillus americanus]|uniref:SET domain-containing protein n=1 Tax=Gomphillus americanus TaxID=1940652 RepID=A0A8H3ELJ7_9LECA|nr:MAG: hypothetical protein GOMPHAMPRED_006349 [Gomphillus americanus]
MSQRQPSHPGILEVVTKPGAFASYAIAKRVFAPGETIAVLKTPPLLYVDAATYTSVQVGPGGSDNVELNSDFQYINHSCDPNLEFHVKNNSQGGSTAERPAGEQSSQDVTIYIRVVRREDDHGNVVGIKADELLTFFYPSTEYNMVQAFDCLCKSSKCLGKIRGAKYLPAEMVFGKDRFFNEHILYLKAEEQGTSH